MGKCVIGTLIMAAGAVFAGMVVYKIIKKKNPELFNNVKERTSEIIKGAKESFHAGYAQA